MEDWRLHGDEDFLKNAVLYEIKFPEYWKKAYREKNSFYRLIQNDAENYVKAMNRGMEFLEGEKIQHFWHEHCCFCWSKATTDQQCLFYCTEDMQNWICAECFNDFKDKFKWIVKSGDELCWKKVPKQRGIIKATPK